MNKLALVATLLLATSLQANNRTSTKVNFNDFQPLSLKTMKVKMSLVQSLSVDANITENGSTSDVSAGNETGVSFGVQDIKTRSLGYTSSLSFLNIRLNDIMFSIKSIELNATYGLQDNAYVFGGFNRSEISNGFVTLAPRNSTQFGFGYKLNENLSLELAKRQVQGQLEDAQADVEMIDFNLNYIL